MISQSAVRLPVPKTVRVRVSCSAQRVQRATRSSSAGQPSPDTAASSEEPRPAAGGIVTSSGSVSGGYCF